MTKLVEWITGFVLIVAVWYAILTQKIGAQLSQDHPLLVLLWPVGLVALFGIYSVAVSSSLKTPSAGEHARGARYILRVIYRGHFSPLVSWARWLVKLCSHKTYSYRPILT